jgi:hypothetical protein
MRVAGGDVREWKFPTARFPHWVLAVIFVTGCLLYSASHAFRGRVVDKKSGKPISGAVVVVIWKGVAGNVPESGRQCAHTETAMTDANGQYHIENWLGSWYGKYLLMSENLRYFVVYKAEYRSPLFPALTEPDIYIDPYTVSKDEWFQELRNGFVMCLDAPPESQSKLSLLFSTIASDAEVLAETPAQKDEALRMRRRANLYKPEHGVDEHH